MWLLWNVIGVWWERAVTDRSMRDRAEMWWAMDWSELRSVVDWNSLGSVMKEARWGWRRRTVVSHMGRGWWAEGLA
jgi:hypothetical protein